MHPHLITSKSEPVMKRIFLFVLPAMLALSCSRQFYQTGAYNDLSGQHHTVAVLPAETVTTGRIPSDLTPEMVEAIEENESRAFQMALFDQVSRQTGRPEQNVKVNIQHYAETNAKLEKAGIGIRESWNMPPSELAEVLGVDAVVRATVRKEWFLTNLESFGLNLARSVIFLFSNGPWWIIPNDRTSVVLASASIIDGRSGASVWNTEINRDTDWNTSHSEIVRRIARKLARRFPYRS